MAAREPRLQIVVGDGPAAGGQLRLREGTFVIGRDPNGDLVLSGDETVSKRHAEVIVERGAVRLRNLSANGTLVNGRPIMETPLAEGDQIAIGLVHLLAVEPYVVRAPKPVGRPVFDTGRTVGGWTPDGFSKPASTAPPAAEAAAAPKPSRRLPTWLVVYLGFMALLFVVLGVMQFGADATAGLSDVMTREEQFAEARQLSADDTARLLRLLETAAVFERRGDPRSAYEAYREVLSVRQPVQPQSPAYRYAAGRLAALGPK